MKDVRRAACAKRTSRRGTKAAASPEALEVIRLRHELLGGQAEATAPKVKAATRALEAGFAVPMIRRALEAIRAADRDGADERSLAAFCATRNRSFEYALRPDVLQRLLDEADAARPAPIRVVRPETTGPVILGPRKLA